MLLVTMNDWNRTVCGLRTSLLLTMIVTQMLLLLTMMAMTTWMMATHCCVCAFLVSSSERIDIHVRTDKEHTSSIAYSMRTVSCCC
jgi:hypothetical protein